MTYWQKLNTEAALDHIKEASFNRPQLIFKHSISCGISAHILDGLETATKQLSSSMDLHYLDLINHRNVSNLTASKFGVPHQSPQVILIKDGKVVYNASHFSIDASLILQAA